MIYRFQEIIHEKNGDCLRASIAALFELDLIQVPHFILYRKRWWEVYYWFVWGLGYQLHGSRTEITDIGNFDASKRFDSIPETFNGCVKAAVPSKTYEGASHAVVINLAGEVVCDPNPNQNWLGVNIIESEEMIDWDLILRRDQ